MESWKKNRNALRFALILAVVAVICEIGFCSESSMRTLGGLLNIAPNGGEIESVGRFAVQQHNTNQVLLFFRSSNYDPSVFVKLNVIGIIKELFSLKSILSDCWVVEIG